MSKASFADFVLEILMPWRPVNARRMFVGHGIHHAEVMFALVADGTLCLKVDEASRAHLLKKARLEALQCQPRSGRRMAKPTQRAPQ